MLVFAVQDISQHITRPVPDTGQKQLQSLSVAVKVSIGLMD